MRIIPEADYICTLLSVESDIGRIRLTPYTRLYMETKEPVTTEVDIGETICTLVEKTKLMCYVFGSHDNLIAWKRLIGQDFTVRIRYKNLPEHNAIVMDTRLRP